MQLPNPQEFACYRRT